MILIVINDLLKISFLLVVREKKKIGYILVYLICCLIYLIVLTFNYNMDGMISKALNSNIGYRSLSVIPRNGSDGVNNDFEDLLQINHVVDVFTDNYREVSVESSLKNDNLDGNIILRRATNDTLPTIVTGNSFSDESTVGLVCPLEFYPSYDYLNIKKDYIISGNIILNTNIDIFYYDYIINQFGDYVENNEYSQNLKIIGLYDTRERTDENNVCYAPSSIIEEIADIQNNYEDDFTLNNVKITNEIVVVVDDISNVNDVVLQMQNKNFYFDGTINTIDIDGIKLVKLFITIVIFLTIMANIFIIYWYNKKSLLSDKDNITTMFYQGYPSKIISFIYATKLLIISFITFWLALIVFIILSHFLYVVVPFLVSFILIYGEISLSFKTILISFILGVLIPYLIMYIQINKYTKNILR